MLDAIFYFQIKSINNNKEDYYYNIDKANATSEHKYSNNKIDFTQILCCKATRILNNAINY